MFDIVERADRLLLFGRGSVQRDLSHRACGTHAHQLHIFPVVDAQRKNSGDHKGRQDDRADRKHIARAVCPHHTALYTMQSALIPISVHTAHLPKGLYRPQCG